MLLSAILLRPESRWTRMLNRLWEDRGRSGESDSGVYPVYVRLLVRLLRNCLQCLTRQLLVSVDSQIA